MRRVDLALYADTLAARASALAARLERARDELRQDAIERAARRALDETTVSRLEGLGLLAVRETGAKRANVAALAADVAAVETLQAWVEARLAELEEAEPVEELRRAG